MDDRKPRSGPRSHQQRRIVPEDQPHRRGHGEVEENLRRQRHGYKTKTS